MTVPTERGDDTYSYDVINLSVDKGSNDASTKKVGEISSKK
jgi:hypothetical protein